MSKEHIGLEDTEKFLKYEYKFERKDLNNNAVDEISFKQEDAKVTFNGLTKEQVMQYGKDPSWVKIRWAIFVLFWVVWIGMIVGAILIIYKGEKCPHRPKLNWWEKEIVYQIDVENFLDSDGNGRGDLNGLISKLDYFDEIGAKTLLLAENFIDKSSPLNVNPNFGDDATMKLLRKNLDDRDMHLIIDLSQAHLNDTSILSHWVENHVDGVRITNTDLKTIENNATSWILKVNEIAKSKFKTKYISFYPFDSNGNYSFNPSTVINRKFIEQRTANSNSVKNFKLSENANSFILGDFLPTSKRITDDPKFKEDDNLLKMYHAITLLLKGTPYLLYGDELEFETGEKQMKWDNSKNCGFSTNLTILTDNCKKNVKSFSATGAGNTLIRIYKTMSDLRKEPSFQWGSIVFNENTDDENLVAFKREAERFEVYLIAANYDTKSKIIDFKNMFKIVADIGKVVYFSSNEKNNHEFKVGNEIKLDNILLKHGELLVVSFKN